MTIPWHRVVLATGKRFVWLKRFAEHFRRVIWWNPEPSRAWEYTRSTQIVLQAVGPRMFPLTLDGIAQGINALRH